MTSEKHTLTDDPVKRGFETSDASAKGVALAGLALSAGLMIAGILFSWGLYTVFKGYAPAPNAAPKTFVTVDTVGLPPIPRLQPDPHVVLVPLIKSQDSVLSSYGWVSRDSGIARIPIDRAMELVVKNGLPVQSK